MSFEALFLLFSVHFGRFVRFFNFFQLHSVLAVFAGQSVKTSLLHNEPFSASWEEG